jgi:hypothetical protein
MTSYIYIYIYVYIYIYETMTKPLAIALNGVRRGAGGGEGNLTSIQCKPIWNCYNECPLYNEYTLIKMKKKECFL